MPGLTLEQLKAAGAKPVAKKPRAGGLTLEELQASGAKPLKSAIPRTPATPEAAPVEPTAIRQVNPQTGERVRTLANAGGIGGDLVDVGIGAVKGGADTLFTPARKVAQIAEISGKKAISAAQEAGVKQLTDIGNRMSDALRSMTPDDPRRQQLQRSIKDNQGTIAKLTGTNAPNEATVTAGTDETLSFLKPKNTAQSIGYGAEKIAEFLVPAAAVEKGISTVTKGEQIAGAAGKVLNPVSKVFRSLNAAGGELNAAGKFVKGTAELATRAAAEGGAAGLITAAQGRDPEDIKTAALVGAAFPVAGKILSTAAKPFRALLKGTGEKIQETVIRPTLRDYKDGFRISNVNKYGVGGSLEETVTKTHTAMNKLTQQLRDELKAAGAEGATVDLNGVVATVKNRLLKNKARNFGSNNQIDRVFGSMVDDLMTTTDGKALVDLVDATNLKRGAGTKGAWSFGNADPDATAVQKVYTTFYQEIRKAIEKEAPDAVKATNKAISDLIPISNAALRRLPISQRNNILSLTDTIGLYSAVFDPKALALIGANRLSKSGKFGQFLVKAAESKSRTPVGKLFFGK